VEGVEVVPVDAVVVVDVDFALDSITSGWNCCGNAFG
jgi:hypothetical protein